MVTGAHDAPAGGCTSAVVPGDVGVKSSKNATVRMSVETIVR